MPRRSYRHSLLPVSRQTVPLQGAYFNDQPVKVSKTKELKDAAMSFGNLKYFQKRKSLLGLVELTEKVQWARGIGDFWSYHLLAQGKIDLMLEAQTNIWDVAALSIIVEEAGGTVTDLNGKPLDLHSTSVIACNGLLHEQIQAYFPTE